MIGEGLDALLNAQNADGGWGVAAGRRSNTEATAFALVALGALDWTASSPTVSRGLQWLARRQNPGGSWSLGDDTSVGRWVTPLAMLASSVFERGPATSVARAANWLVRQQGRRLGWLVHGQLTVPSSASKHSRISGFG